MSTGICRLQKIKTANGIAGMQIHDRREKDHSNSNPDIDFGRSSTNVTLIDVQGSFNDHIAKQLKERYTGTTKIRSDAVKMVSVIFTSDGDFFRGRSQEEQLSFFQSCLDFAKRKWGEENIISAVIHND